MKPESTEKRWLNPFALPSETNARFVLFAVAALMVTSYATFDLLPVLSVLSQGRLTPAILRYDDGAVSIPNLPDSGLDDEEYVRQYEQWRHQAISTYEATARDALRILGLEAAPSLAAFALAALIYLTYPAYIRLRANLHPVLQAQDPALHREIGNLIDRTGISPPPAVEIASGLRSHGGQAFGLRRPYAIGLGGGFRLLLRKAPSKFRAIVLHELAHISNQDVWRTYLSQALWIAVILVTIVILLISEAAMYLMVTRNAIPDWLSAIPREGNILLTDVLLLAFPWLQLGAIFAVFAFVRASLLRIREMYADTRAAQWGVGNPLCDILVHHDAKGKKGAILRLLRLHPTARERLVVLRDPARLFRATLDLPFIVGLLVACLTVGLWIFTLDMAIALGSMGMAVGTLVGTDLGNSDFLAGVGLWLVSVSGEMALAVVLVPVLGAGYLVSGTLGLQTLREAVAHPVAERRSVSGYARLLIPALLFAAGLEVGYLIAPNAIFSPVGASLRGDSPGLPCAFASFIGVTVSTWLSLTYLRFFGQKVLGTRLGASQPKWGRRLLTLAFSTLLWVSYSLALFTRWIGMFGTQSGFGRAASPAFFLAALIGVALVNGTAFGGTWVVIQLGRLIRPPRCPRCGHIIDDNGVLARQCGHCGDDLSTWLFVQRPLGSDWSV